MPKFKKSTRGFKMKAGKEGPFKKNFPNDIGSPNKFLGGLIAKGVGKLAGKALGGGVGKMLGGGGGGGGALGAVGSMVGGPLGGLAGRAIGGLLGRKKRRGAALTKKSAYKKDDKKKKRYLHPSAQKSFRDRGIKLKTNWHPVTGEFLGYIKNK